MAECSPNRNASTTWISRNLCMTMAMHGFLRGVCSPCISSNSKCLILSSMPVLSQKGVEILIGPIMTLSGLFNSVQDPCRKTSLHFLSCAVGRVHSPLWARQPAGGTRKVRVKEEPKPHAQASSNTEICSGIRHLRNSLDGCCFLSQSDMFHVLFIYWLECKLYKKAFLSLLFRAVSLVPRTVPGIKLIVHEVLNEWFSNFHSQSTLYVQLP